MSSSRMILDGRRQPGRSNFVQTCNLLSRYIKEKGSLRDLNLEIGGKVESLEAIVKSGSTHPASPSPPTIDNVLANKRNSAQLLIEKQPSMAPISSSDAPLSKEDPKPSQLTIFYSGRVLVFDDYEYERAEELMAFAKNENSKISYGTLSNIISEKSSMSSVVGAVSSLRDGLPPRPQASTSPHKGASSSTCKENTVSPTSTEANGSDLPIARRSSLHRFLEKRKDRAGARGPYHQAQEHPESSSKGDEQLELRL